MPISIIKTFEWTQELFLDNELCSRSVGFEQVVLVEARAKLSDSCYMFGS